MRCVFSPLSLKRTSLCDDRPLVRGDNGGERAPKARLQKATTGPLVQGTVPSQRLAAALTHRPSRTGLGFAGGPGSVSTEKKPEGHFALETG